MSGDVAPFAYKPDRFERIVASGRKRRGVVKLARFPANIALAAMPQQAIYRHLAVAPAALKSHLPKLGHVQPEAIDQQSTAVLAPADVTTRVLKRRRLCCGRIE